MRVEHPLHLGGVDVEAADEDQVAAPVDEVQVAVVVPVGEVTGAQPAVGVGPVGTVGPVTGEEVGPADPDLARTVEVLVAAGGGGAGPRGRPPAPRGGPRPPGRPPRGSRGRGAGPPRRATDRRCSWAWPDPWQACWPPPAPPPS